MARRETLVLLSLCAGALLLFGLLSWGTAQRESMTYDEPVHLTSGYAYWTTGKYFSDPIHPPLLRLWAAAPLALKDLQPFYPPPSWVVERRLALSDWFLHFNKVSADALLEPARAMMLVLALLFAVVLGLWAKELFGLHAMVPTLFLYAFCPALLAYAPLVTTDFGAAAFPTLFLYLAWRFLKQPTRGRALAAGIGLGLALMVKFTSLLFIPIAGLVGWLEWRSWKEKKEIPPYSVVFFLVGIVAIILLAYRGTELARLAQGYFDLREALSSDPGQYFKGTTNLGRPWIWFYSVCFFLKTPFPYFILALAPLLIRKDWPKREAFRWLLLPALLYLAVLSFQRDQMGVRRILFLYPMLCLWTGGGIAYLIKEGDWVRRGVLILGLWGMAETLWYYPRYFAYFNQAAGGPAGGSRYLVDCNSDWGQGLAALGKFMQDSGSPHLYLNYFGSAAPRDYGMHFINLDPEAGSYLRAQEEPDLRLDKEKRVYLAISATPLSGANYGGEDPFAWLRSRHPVALLMDSIFVYDLTLDSQAHRELYELFKKQGRDALAERERLWWHRMEAEREEVAWVRRVPRTI